MFIIFLSVKVLYKTDLLMTSLKCLWFTVLLISFICLLSDHGTRSARKLIVRTYIFLLTFHLEPKVFMIWWVLIQLESHHSCWSLITTYLQHTCSRIIYYKYLVNQFIALINHCLMYSLLWCSGHDNLKFRYIINNTKISKFCAYVPLVYHLGVV